MKKNVKVRIVRGELNYFKNSDTGAYDKPMTKIYYLVKQEESDRVVGSSYKYCFKNGDLREILKPYTEHCQEVLVDIAERPTENGTKDVIETINNKQL